MMVYVPIVQSVVIVVLAFIILNLVQLHKRELTSIIEESREEREKLLDRIMANNITEYKTARNEANVNRSPNSNFLKDQMTKAAQNYVDFDQ